MQKLALYSLMFALPSLASYETLADIYKCTLEDGSTVFEQQCPSNAKKAEKLALKEATSIRLERPAVNNLRPGDILIRNGGFENGLDGWQVTVGEPTVIEREGITGSNGLSFATSSDAETLIRLRQCLPVAGIGKAAISAFVKQEGTQFPSINELRVVWFSNETCADNGQFNALLKPTAAPGWQKLEETELTPALGAQSLLVELAYTSDSSSDALVLWDDIELVLTQADSGQSLSAIDASKTLPIGQNHLKNHDFNDTLSHWHSEWPVEWDKYSGQEVTAGVRVKASSDFGKKIKGEALSQCVNFGSNRNFNLSASVKRDPMSSQQGSTSMVIYWLQGPDCSGRQQLGEEVTGPTREGWQTFSESLTAPEGAQSALIKAYQVVDGTGLYAVFWDNLLFVATESPSL